MDTTIIVIAPNHEVLCDICNADWTDSPETGGFLLLSKGVCPVCEPRMKALVAKHNEEWSIKGECPEDISFADWIRSIR